MLQIALKALAVSEYENLTLVAQVFEYILENETYHHLHLLTLRCPAIKDSKANNGLATVFIITRLACSHNERYVANMSLEMRLEFHLRIAGAVQLIYLRHKN